VEIDAEYRQVVSTARLPLAAKLIIPRSLADTRALSARLAPFV
jgi:hypothetical protein